MLGLAARHRLRIGRPVVPYVTDANLRLLYAGTEKVSSRWVDYGRPNTAKVVTLPSGSPDGAVTACLSRPHRVRCRGGGPMTVSDVTGDGAVEGQAGKEIRT